MALLSSLDLFTGVGGLTLALEPWARPVAYCEADPDARAVLLARMADSSLPNCPIWDDVRTLHGSMVPDVDLIVGGFPCQDLSVAGKRAGLDGERSGLYREVLRLVDECKPTFVFLENVPGVRAHLARIAEDLSRYSYDLRVGSLSAASVGSPQLRDRVFMLAANTDRLKLWEQSGRGGGASGSEALQPPPPPAQGVAAHHHQGQLQPKGAEPEVGGRSLHGIVTAWRDNADEGIHHLVHGVSVRMVDQRLLGNACIPAQAREAFRQLMGLP